MHQQQHTRHLMGSRRKGSRLQSGQSIIIIAFAIVALIAIGGLAIDGGGMLLLQRDVQGASDAAVQAATFSLCSGGSVSQVEQAGATAAALNGYPDIDGITTDDMSDHHDVEIYNPPISGEKAGDPNYVEAIVTAEKQKFFIQIVYSGPMVTTSRAVGRCIQGEDAQPYNQTFTALSCDGNSINITGDMTVTGGAYSCGNLNCSGTTCTFNDGGISTGVEGWTPTENINTSTSPETGDYRDFASLMDIGDFAPGGDIASVVNEYCSYDGDATLPADRCDGLPITDPLTGLYYVDGDLTVTCDAVFEDPNNPPITGVSFVATGNVEFLDCLTGQSLTYYDEIHDLTGYGPTIISGSDVVSSSGTVENRVMDFDTLPTGARTAEINAAFPGVTLSTNNESQHPLMIFDSENPTGGDDDLQTPGYGYGNDTALGKILIIDEHNNPADPDDNGSGGYMYFNFDEPTAVNSITWIDIDEASPPWVEIFDQNGQSIAYVQGVAYGDNSVQTWPINVTGAARMTVYLPGSGAIADLDYTTPVTQSCEGTGVILPGSENEITGLVYSPNGCVNISGNDNTYNGVIVGQELNLDGTQQTYNYSDEALAPTAPQIVYAE